MSRTGVLLAVLLGSVMPAFAGNGSWTQVDAWNGGVQWVTNVDRGAWQLGMSGGRDDEEWWAKTSVLRAWSIGPDRAPWKLRGGVVASGEQIQRWEAGDYDLTHCWSNNPDSCAAFRFGARLSVDRWVEYGSWGLFLMGEYTTIDNSKLAVVGLTHLPTRLGAQISLWHEDEGELTPAVMLSAPLTKRLSIRFGYKFVEEETFLGLSFSTF